MILRQETIDRFGYDPYELKLNSNKLILVQCPICNKVQECRRQSYHDGRLCRICNATRVRQLSNPKKPKKYRSDAELREASRSYQRKTNLTRFTTPKGKIISRISSNLRNAIKGRGVKAGTFGLLDYTPSQVATHILKRLEDCNYVCPMCNKADLHEAYDIDHHIPLATAKTVEDVIRLFALDNLNVLCPTCNRKIKRDKF